MANKFSGRSVHDEYHWIRDQLPETYVLHAEELTLAWNDLLHEILCREWACY